MKCLSVYGQFYILQLLAYIRTILSLSYCYYKIGNRSKKFGPYMKCLLIVLVPIPIALWTVVGVAGSAVMGAMYGFIWPVMETFRAISKEGSIFMKLIRCFTVSFL